MSVTQDWVAAITTIGLWSWLIDRENPYFDMIQYLFIGLAFAYDIGINYADYLRPNLVKIGQGQWTLIIPIILGLLVYARYFKQIDYLGSWGLSFLVGYGAGYVLAFQPAVFLGQVSASFYKLWGVNGAVAAKDWITLLLLLCGIVYFFFTVKKERFVGGVSQVGRYAIMLALGTGFGSTILFRWSLLFGRVYFIFHTWLHVV